MLCFVLEKKSKTMKCYWRTVLLILAVKISSSTPVPSEAASSVTPEETTQTSIPKNTSTEATIPPTSSSTFGPTSPPNNQTTSEEASITTSKTTGVTEETSTAPAAGNNQSTSSSSISPSTPPAGTSPSTPPTSTSPSTPPTGTSPSTPQTDTSPTTPTSISPSASPTDTSPSTPTTGTSPSTPITDTSPSTPPTGTSPSTPPIGTSPSTPPPNTSESIATSSSSVATTPAAPSLGVLISETNLLLANDSSRHFVELQVTKNVDIDIVWLVIQNASMNSTEGLLLKQINISSFENGLYLYENDTDLSNELESVDSVLIALYDNEGNANQLSTKGLLDILLYSSSGNINLDLKERFAINQNLIVDYEKLKISVPVSLSRCSEKETANSVAALTNESPGKLNNCNFTLTNPLQMKLTRKILPCSPDYPKDFQSALMDSVISDVNNMQKCGLAAYMLKDMQVKPACISDGKELDVTFTVVSAFLDQVTLINKGYKNFLSQNKLTINKEEYDLSQCYEHCFDQPASKKDDKIRVTVAVVVSCIGVFLVVLLFVVLYLRRKRRGVLQFHMTRLDEDDDLAGDMDDFVGNQGPTFRNYR